MRTSSRLLCAVIGLATAVGMLPFDRTCECATALRHALITRPEAVPDATRKKLAPIVGKYLDPK